MQFDLSEDQQDIKRTARDLLASRSGWEQVRAAAEKAAYDDALWRELCDLGWPGIAIAEEHGGQGLGLVELCVLLEELGSACAVTPLLGSALAGLAIADSGSDSQRERWLGELTGMRDRINSVRQRIAAADPRLAFIGRQFGMFSMLPLSKEQVLKLREDSAIYMADSGRFNVVGLGDDQIDRFIAAVVGALDA